MTRSAATILAALVLALPLAAQEEPDLRKLTAADAALACDLYRTLRSSETGDFFYSPHSIASALAMTRAGARGDTADEMTRVLYLGGLAGDADLLRSALDRELAKRERPRPGEEGGDPFRLRLVNALWGQVDHAFRPEFLEYLARHYGAGLRLVDFKKDPDAARRAINAEIEDSTEKRVKDLLNPDDVGPATRLVLTNAIYFKASWLHAFEPSATRGRPFHRLDGSTVEVPLMALTESFAYAAEDGLQAVELPYVGGEIALVVLLPAAGDLRFAAFEESLGAERLAAILARLGQAQVALRLPRFGVESRFSLRDALQSLGMTRAFVYGQADFSGMDGTKELFVSDVIHKSFVEVDEKGTEAAAATAVIMDEGGMPSRPVEMTVDRPFVFLVRDVESGAVLFMGRVVDPKSE